VKVHHAVLAGLALSQLTCHQVLFTAPPGSSLTVIANPTFIPANTGVSVISAIVYDPTGSPVADGTVIQFFTNLGRIDEQGRTNDGVARVNLYADSRSGTAEVHAFIPGGSATAPSPTPGGGGVAAAVVDSSVEVRIGSQRPVAIILTASPQRITQPRFATIAANVFDEFGNAVSNVPVFFSLSTDGAVLEESLDSGSSPVFTDNNGRASDALRTSYDRDAPPKTVTVTATTPTGAGNLSATVSVAVN
jgi:hypothetical protein